MENKLLTYDEVLKQADELEKTNKKTNFYL